MTQPTYPCVLGDVGGTNARFAMQDHPGGAIRNVRSIPCAEHASLEAALRHYLADSAEDAPRAAAIGIAASVRGDFVQMTNHHWSFSIEALKQSLQLQRLCVVNDFTALAMALPTLAPEQLSRVGGGQAVPGTPLALLGAGTGLGVAGLVPTTQPDVWLPITGEGGHVTLAAESEDEFAVLSVLRARYGHVSAERVLSGPGLVDLYGALQRLRAAPSLSTPTPAQVIEWALAGNDPIAHEALDLFCAWLGSVAGNLALTLGARGGVYVGGGIVPRLGERFGQSAFRARFEAKGRFRDYLAAIPVHVITARESPALAGAARAFSLQQSP